MHSSFAGAPTVANCWSSAAFRREQIRSRVRRPASGCTTAIAMPNDSSFRTPFSRAGSLKGAGWTRQYLHQPDVLRHGGYRVVTAVDDQKPRKISDLRNQATETGQSGQQSAEQGNAA